MIFHCDLISIINNNAPTEALNLIIEIYKDRPNDRTSILSQLLVAILPSEISNNSDVQTVITRIFDWIHKVRNSVRRNKQIEISYYAVERMALIVNKDAPLKIIKLEVGQHIANKHADPNVLHMICKHLRESCHIGVDSETIYPLFRNEVNLPVVRELIKWVHIKCYNLNSILREIICNGTWAYADLDLGQYIIAKKFTNLLADLVDNYPHNWQQYLPKLENHIDIKCFMTLNACTNALINDAYTLFIAIYNLNIERKRSNSFFQYIERRIIRSDNVCFLEGIKPGYRAGKLMDLFIHHKWFEGVKSLAYHANYSIKNYPVIEEYRAIWLLNCRGTMVAEIMENIFETSYSDIDENSDV